MSIPSDAKATPLPYMTRPVASGGLSNPTASGGWADGAAWVSGGAGKGIGNVAADALTAQSAQERLRNYVNGAGRTFSCAATGTNLITLTPNGHGDEDGASPLLEGYIFGDCFLFWAENTSTGAVTATVVPKTGTLDTLKVYKSNGAAQAGNGDVVANSLYVAYYVPILDSNAGGLVLK